MGYRRTTEDEQALVLLNFGGAEQSLRLPASPAGWQVRLSSTGRATDTLPAEIRLAESEALILTNG